MQHAHVTFIRAEQRVHFFREAGVDVAYLTADGRHFGPHGRHFGPHSRYFGPHGHQLGSHFLADGRKLTPHLVAKLHNLRLHRRHSLRQLFEEIDSPFQPIHPCFKRFA